MSTVNYPEMPPLMAERHKVLNKVYRRIKEDPSIIKRVFNFEKTVHADLDLSWIDEKFQRKEIGSPEDYQIVVATIKAKQVSDAHLHEKGASSFIVLGEKTGFNESKKLIYRTGMIEFPSLRIKKLNEVNCREELEMDIPSYIVHQFENKGDKDAHLLIVTHPIIYVKEGKEDIHFVKKS